jgi:hypothetical protein
MIADAIQRAELIIRKIDTSSIRDKTMSKKKSFPNVVLALYFMSLHFITHDKKSIVSKTPSQQSRDSVSGLLHAGTNVSDETLFAGTLFAPSHNRAGRRRSTAQKMA